jgi:hypothetical protein
MERIDSQGIHYRELNKIMRGLMTIHPLRLMVNYR